MKCKPCADLKDQDRGKAIPKLRFALLVPENDHSGYAADRAAQNRKNKEHGLRNTESALHCAYLINDHSGKAEQIHNEKIEKKHDSCVHERLLSKIPEVYCISLAVHMQEENN